MSVTYHADFWWREPATPELATRLLAALAVAGFRKQVESTSRPLEPGDVKFEPAYTSLGGMLLLSSTPIEAGASLRGFETEEGPAAHVTFTFPERTLRWHPEGDAEATSDQLLLNAALLGFFEAGRCWYGYADPAGGTWMRLWGKVGQRDVREVEGEWVLRARVPEIHPLNFLPREMVERYPGLIPTSDEHRDSRIRVVEIRDGGRMLAFGTSFVGRCAEYDRWAWERKIELEAARWLKGKA